MKLIKIYVDTRKKESNVTIDNQTWFMEQGMWCTCGDIINFRYKQYQWHPQVVKTYISHPRLNSPNLEEIRWNDMDWYIEIQTYQGNLDQIEKTTGLVIPIKDALAQKYKIIEKTVRLRI